MVEDLGNNMAWVDLETTGLSALKDVPLEVGIVLTDAWGEPYTERSWLIFETSLDYKEALTRAKNNQFIHDMHTANGLWEDLKPDNPYLYTRQSADDSIVKWLENNGVPFGKYGMAGKSTGSLDRPFCLEHFPRLNAHLGYRNIDMSSIWEIMKRVNPELAQSLSDERYQARAETAHRAVADCHEAIDHYIQYQEEFLICVSED